LATTPRPLDTNTRKGAGKSIISASLAESKEDFRILNTALLENVNQTCEASVSYGIPTKEVVSTGIPQLDAVMGGGIPQGRIVEVYGTDGSGKTALALHLARRLPSPTLYVDADHGLSPYILRRQELYLMDVGTLEDTIDACMTAVVGGFGSIVIDTVAAMPTNEDMRIGINNKRCSLTEYHARIMSRALPILAPLLHRTGCTLILVNQLRNIPGVMYGRPDRPAGGRAIGYYAALQLETFRLESVKYNDDFTIGQKVLVRVQKCKYGIPGKRAEIKLFYGQGIRA